MSGLIVPVPSWNDFVSHWRAEVDRVVPSGIPAHVTVLFPWVRPTRIEEEMPRLVESLSEVDAFEFTLTGVERFENDGGTVAYVGVDPEEPFRALTRQLFEAWPDCPPYGGAYGDPTPHMTIGAYGTPEDLDRVRDAAEPLLPDTCSAREVWVMVGTDNPPTWRVNIATLTRVADRAQLWKILSHDPRQSTRRLGRLAGPSRRTQPRALEMWGSGYCPRSARRLL